MKGKIYMKFEYGSEAFVGKQAVCVRRVDNGVAQIAYWTEEGVLGIKWASWSEVTVKGTAVLV